MVKPDINQIEAYMLERQFIEEDQPEAFYDHFEENGWLVGGRTKTKMRCWQAAIRNWIRNHKKWNKPNETSQRHYQSTSDRIRQQADQARAEIYQTQRGIYTGDVRPLRSVG